MENNKNGISASIIADSKNEHGQRITSFVLTFPRFILAELNTHRTFSRNSASSRAIPFNKMVKMVEVDPFIPIAWQKDHKGMQGTEYAEYPDSEDFKQCWLEAMDGAVEAAKIMQTGKVKCTKQIVNRLLEPFMWHTAIVTATEFENFFKLRCPQYDIDFGGDKQVFRSWKDSIAYNETKEYGAGKNLLKHYNPLERLVCNKGQGEIHIMALAEAMWDAMNESEPKQLKAGEWHIPFGDKFNQEKLIDFISDDRGGCDTTPEEHEMECEWASEDYKIKIATARCARVSYLNYEGKDDYEADIKLFNILLKSGHMSPFEHCARAMSKVEYMPDGIDHVDHPDLRGWSGNFRGFVQYRKEIE